MDRDDDWLLHRSRTGSNSVTRAELGIKWIGIRIGCNKNATEQTRPHQSAVSPETCGSGATSHLEHNAQHRLPPFMSLHLEYIPSLYVETIRTLLMSDRCIARPVFIIVANVSFIQFNHIQQL